jgi:putative two-component system response regulator
MEMNNQPDIFEQLYSHAKDLSLLKKELDSALLKIARTEFEVLMKLALVAEYKDTDTSVHIHRIGYMAELLCTLLQQPQEFCFLIRLAAPMHDVGKLGIPDNILQKPGNYDDAERSIMNQHPIIGAKILDISNHTLFQLASEIALTHHEKYDGSGYPYGLAGKNIPFVGRVTAIVDYYDALTMDRCYRKAFSDHDALAMLKKEKGMHFDPEMVDVLEKNQHKFIALRDKVNRLEINFNDLISIDFVKQLNDSDFQTT